MEKMLISMIIWTICTFNADGIPLQQRMKRFILQSGTSSSNHKTQPVPTASFVMDTSKVHCQHKRSTDYQRVILDDDLLQERYLELIGNIDYNIFARTMDEAEANFKHILAPPVKQTKKWSHNNNQTKAEFINDLNKYQTWYNAVLEDMGIRNKTLGNDAASLDDKLDDILSQLGITKTQLKQVLDLKHDIDELKQFKLTNQRIKRDTIGAVRSEQAYCTQRGSSTGTAYLHLCSACAVTTQFPENVFPRYTNEITCDPSDCDCMQATKSIVYGKCQPIVKTVMMLKRKENGCKMVIRNNEIIIEDGWEVYQQPLHVGCECMINKIASLADLIPKH